MSHDSFLRMRGPEAWFFRSVELEGDAVAAAAAERGTGARGRLRLDRHVLAEAPPEIPQVRLE